MKHFTAVLLLLAFAAASRAAETPAQPPRPGVVTAHVLNVRNRPDATGSTVVAKMKEGDAVKVVKNSGEWLEITAPENTAVFVFNKFFADGKTTRDVNLRTGPGVEYQSYGIAPRGTALVSVGEVKNEWQQVKPLDTMTCFVSSKYVRLDDASPASDAPAKQTDANSGAETPPAEDPAAEAERKDAQTLRTLFIPGAEKAETMEGTLVRVSKSNLLCIQYALVDSSTQKRPLCHLTGTDAATAALAGKRVLAQGTLHRIADWKLPVLIVSEIKLAPESTK